MASFHFTKELLKVYSNYITKVDKLRQATLSNIHIRVKDGCARAFASNGFSLVSHQLQNIDEHKKDNISMYDDNYIEINIPLIEVKKMLLEGNHSLITLNDTSIEINGKPFKNDSDIRYLNPIRILNFEKGYVVKPNHISADIVSDFYKFAKAIDKKFKDVHTITFSKEIDEKSLLTFDNPVSKAIGFCFVAMPYRANIDYKISDFIDF